MCRLCDQLNIKIERYKQLRELTNDEQTHETINRLSAELEAKKAALHPGWPPRLLKRQRHQAE